MKRGRLLLALVLAVPLEVVSFVFFPFPIDVGLPDNAGWFAQLLGLRWVLMHYLGLMTSSWLRVPDTLLPGMIFLGGYIEVGILTYFTLRAMDWIRERRRRSEAN